MKTVDDIRLRALEPGDIDIVYRWENDRALWPSGDNAAPLSRYQLHRYIENYSADIYTDRQLRMMITLPDGTAIGTVDLFDFDPVNSRAATGIFISEQFRHQGYATAAIESIKDYCRNRLSMHSLWCVVAVDNVASLTLFKKCGFTTSGRLRSWLRCHNRYGDALLLQILFS